MDSLKLHFPQGTRTVQTDKIVRIEAKSNYSKIFFADGYPLLVAKVLNSFQQQLPPQFIRIHKSHLVNKSYMDKVLLGITRKIILKNGDNLPISRRNKLEWVEN
jgi:two-component system, LytTR family, response regulator